MKHLKPFAFLLLLISCSLYSYWLSNRDFEWIVPYMNDRAPAAVRESKEFQEIIEKPMRVFKREAIVSSIALESHQGKHTVSLGQFPVQGSKGQNLVCLEYPYIRLRLAAEGASVGGRKTQVIVKAPCQMHQRNRDRVTDIPLPFSEIFRQPAQDLQFSWKELNIEIEVQVENVFGDWPKLWELESIEFYKDPANDQDIYLLSKQEFLKMNGEPFFLRF